MKVLVVDDDVVSRMMLMHLVDACAPCEILEAEDGEDAWRLLADGLRPDIVFSDLRMPRLDGLALLARLRADPALAATPFVLVLLAGILFFASIIGIYITNVTATPGGIPRWVLGLGLATLLVGAAALVSAVV